MSPLAVRVARFLRSRALVAPGDRLVIALSGGADSVALLHLLLECARSVRVTVVGIAHLHHGLRGGEADGDEAFCRAEAERAGLPADVGHADVAALARHRGCSIEAAGHDAREDFYERARTALDATLVATGHTANDQAESVLMHVARGAGLRGLGGIRPRAGSLVRPLLGTERQEIERYLVGRSLSYREDSTNEDTDFTRNRVRHRVLPVLQDSLSPRVVDALGRLADLASEDEALLAEWSTQRGAGLTREDGLERRLDLEALAGQPLALRRRIVEHALRQGGRGGHVGLAHVDAVLSLAAARRAGARLSLPGLLAEVAAGQLVLRPQVVRPRLEHGGHDPARGPTAGQGAAGPEPAVSGEARFAGGGGRPIPVPGVLLDVRRRWELTAWLRPPMDEPAARRVAAGRTVAVLDAERAGAQLFVRFRQPGDRLRPLGMSGHRKLQDVFVDARVPRQARDEVPLVVDGAGRIVWVVGHCIAEGVRVSDRTTGVLLLEIRHLGGLG